MRSLALALGLCALVAGHSPTPAPTFAALANGGACTLTNNLAVEACQGTVEYVNGRTRPMDVGDACVVAGVQSYCSMIGSPRTGQTLTCGAPVAKSGFYFVLGCYCMLLFGVAVIGQFQQQADVVKDADAEYSSHFMGNKSLGWFFGFMTLFSTIFSGYTINGVPTEAVSLSYFSVRWLTSAISVQFAGLLFTPRMRRISVVRNMQSPNDIVTDRYNNRALTLANLFFLSANNIIYMVAQLYTLYNVIGAVTDDVINPTSATWGFAVMILVCEFLGGFRAVAYSDSVQSAIMMFAMIAIACVFENKYGGLAGFSEPGCSNPDAKYEPFVACDCIASALNETSGTCDLQADNVCTALAPRGWSAGERTAAGSPVPQPHHMCLNAVGDEVARAAKAKCPSSLIVTVERKMGCLAEVAHSTAVWNPAAYPITGETEGPFVSQYYNRMPLRIFDFDILFLAFILNAHWTTRIMAVKTDAAVKKMQYALTFIGLVVTFPGLIEGMGAKANYQNAVGGTSGFGVIVNQLMSGNHFENVIGILACCASTAAIMSTTDSACLSTSNMVTTDGLKNGIAPNITNASLAWAAKLCSTISMLLAVVIALYLPDLHDAASAGSTYGDMISFQNLLLWQAMPTNFAALYAKTVNPTQLLLGIVAGFTSAMVLFLAVFRDPVGTPSAEKYGVGGPDERGEMYFHPGVWGGFINMAVVFITNAIGVNIPMKELEFTPALLRKYGEKRLDYNVISEIMSTTVEPVFTPIGSVCMFTGMVAANACLPFYKDSMSDVTWVNGLPQWFVGCFCGYFIGAGMNLIAWTQWKTPDNESWFGPLVGDLDSGEAGDATPSKIYVDPPAGPSHSQVVITPGEPQAAEDFSFST